MARHVTLKVGIIGTGGMGKVHAHAFMRNRHCEVVAAAGHTKKNLDRFVRGDWDPVVYDQKLGDFTPLYPIPKAYESWQALLEDKEVNVVSITSPNALHFLQAKEALKRGKHVLVEKPLCVSLRQARSLVTLARKTKSKACVAQVWRFNPQVQEAKRIIQSGQIGKVVKVNSFGIHRLWGPSGWFRDPKLSGGGALLDMGVHGLDTVRFVLGEPKAESVAAYITSAFSAKRKGKGVFFVDDLGILLIRFRNGPPCLLESGWNLPYAEGGEATSIFTSLRGYVKILPFEAGRISGKKMVAVEPKTNLSISAEELYQRQIDHFVSVVLGREKNNIIPLSIGLESMKIMEAAYRAAATGKTVRVFD